MERNIFSDNDFVLSPVYDFSIFTGDFFMSGDKDIDEFFYQDAERHYRDGMSVTYKLSAYSPQNLPFAFITLQNDAIKIQEEMRKKTGYPYTYFPAVKIGRLGVQKNMQGAGVGSILLKMTSNFMRHANRTGCRFITLDAYNTDSVIRFYEKNNFILLKQRNPNKDTAPMFFDMY